MQIISIINYKGGVGKTTLTANLGAGLARQGKKVLLIDVDPQTSLTFSFLKPDDWRAKIEPAKTIKTWHDAFGSSQHVPLHTLAFSPEEAENALNGRGRLDLISSHLDLINLDLELATQLGGGTLPQVRRTFMQVHDRLRSELSAIPPGTYDYVLIDCPPNFNVVTKNAIAASDSILIPARPDYLSTLGIQYLLRHIDQLVKDFAGMAGGEGAEALRPINPAILGVVFTMVQFFAEKPTTAQQTYIQNVRALPNGPRVFESMIRYNTAGFADAPESGLPMILSNHSNKSADAAKDSLLSLVDEFLTHTQP
jgi:chromosome partitioning protein